MVSSVSPRKLQPVRYTEAGARYSNLGRVVVFSILPWILIVAQLTYTYAAPVRVAAILVALIPLALWAIATAAGPDSAMGWFFGPRETIELTPSSVTVHNGVRRAEITWAELVQVTSSAAGPVLMAEGGKALLRLPSTFGRVLSRDGKGEYTLAMAIVAYRPDRYVLGDSNTESRLRAPDDKADRITPLRPTPSGPMPRSLIIVGLVVIVLTVVARLLGL